MEASHGRSQIFPACVLNSTLIELYKGNVLGFMRLHGFIHLDFFIQCFLNLSVCHVSVENPHKALYMRFQDWSTQGLRSLIKTFKVFEHLLD